MSADAIITFIKKNQIEFVDLRFCDTRGKEQHVTITANCVDQNLFNEGKAFDGSSIAGWQGIENSDMLLMPDPKHFCVDIFRQRPTLILRCTVCDPRSQQPYELGPRALALRAEQYLRDSGIADTALFGPETEFFIFDKVIYETADYGCQYRVDATEAIWNAANQALPKNLGYHIPLKGGYFPVPPMDSHADLRAEICHALMQMGLTVEVHHHEVATGGQGEIGTRCAPLTDKADQLLITKYVAQSVAHRHGKSLTFMPKPLINDNGNGLHVHQSLSKDGHNIFAGDAYAGLSKTALHYIAGIIHHGKALNAFTNASVNSYRRLVPGFEAPIYLAYSSQNRSAAIRVPYTPSAKSARIEARFPDAMMNPYLAFSAMLMAGLDGIKRELDPGEPQTCNLYDLPTEQAATLPAVCYSLENALEHLKRDCDFLMEGNVFTQKVVDKYIELKQQEIRRTKTCTHPIELELYYDL